MILEIRLDSREFVLESGQHCRQAIAQSEQIRPLVRSAGVRIRVANSSLIQVVRGGVHDAAQNNASALRNIVGRVS